MFLKAKFREMSGFYSIMTVFWHHHTPIFVPLSILFKGNEYFRTNNNLKLVFL